ncbi:MAG: O-antigen ligase family protein [Alphaproteobacteria bacterium]|nr:O-antigen ligase family protein [Alphaproteobacteria bacterium]
MGVIKTFRLHSDAPLLQVLTVIVALLAAFTPLQVWIPAICVAGAIILRRLIARDIRGLRHPRFAFVILAIVVWGMLSSLWSIDPGRSLEKSAKLLLFAAAMIILLDAAAKLTRDEQKSLTRWMIFSALALITLTLAKFAKIEIFTAWISKQTILGNEFDSLNRTASIIAIFVWPFALGIFHLHGRRLATLFVIASTITVFLLPPIAPALALMVGAGVFAAALYAQSLGKTLLVVGFGAFIAMVLLLDTLVPWANQILVTNIDTPNSEVHRFVIWQFAVEHILDRPLFGWGLDSSRVFPGGSADLFLFTNPDGSAATGAAMPLHPHNSLIQIWLELGLVGIGLFAALVGLAFRGTAYARSGNAGAATIMATIASGFVVAQLGFGVWQGWWLATLGFAAVYAAAITQTPDDSTQLPVNE